MNLNKMCMGCMKEKQSLNPVCPLCGYDESERRSPLVMRHRTLLADQYVVGKVLGKPGGFGITYLGWDTRLETMVAIKEYLPRDNAGRDTDQSTVVPHSREDEEIFRYGLEAFLLEARTLAKFDHANVVRVRTFFEANGTGYLVMDYYDGMSLESYLVKKGGKISEKLAVNIMMPVLDGLREVHEKGFLHRDIKPHNIYLTRNGKPILLDFGAARSAMGDRSRSLSVLLTPGYAPYEQYQRKGKQGVWTDIYACGATLYRMVIGKTPPEAIEREIDDDLIAPSKLVNVSRGFQAAVLKSLEMEPSRRQQSIKEFQDMLFSLVSEEDEIPVLEAETPSQPLTPPQVQSSAPTPPPRQTFQPQPLPQSPQPEKKSPMLKWVVIGLVVAAVAFIGYSMGRKQEIQPASTTKTEQVAEPAAESKEESEPVTEEASDAVAKEESEPEPAQEPANREPQAGELFEGHISGMQFAYIPPGTFMMGSPDGKSEQQRKDEVIYTGEEISLDFYETDIRNVLRILQTVSGKNFAIDNDVTGKVTLTLDTPAPWDEILDIVLKMNKLIKIQEGSIIRIATMQTVLNQQIGISTAEPDRQDDETQHEVTLTQGFFMQTTEVTVAQWKLFATSTGYKTEAETGGGAYVWNGKEFVEDARIYWDNPGFTQRDNHPVTCISWNDAQKFIEWLNTKVNVQYRLPTEAEWEYAARAGTTGAYSGNLNSMGWYGDNAGDATHSAALKQSNAWNLYDMHGNVFEWCQDWYGPYPFSSVIDPVGSETGSSRVLRGGSWFVNARSCRSAFRFSDNPFRCLSGLGFRLVCSAGQQ
ncbi:MAG: SUMF1/EgtB/PvdO family nonheme iron enzyme [Desulfamplus sp.]